MKITGHRGAKDEWPENTLLGMRKAIETGVTALEIDVHLSKDNRLVVIHDPTLDRTTDSTGTVSELTYSEIRSANAGEGEKVPSLEEVLDLTISSNIQLFIEAKAFGIKKELLQLIEAKSAFDHVFVISFDHRLIKNLSLGHSSIRTGCLMVAAPIDPVSIVESAGAKLLAISTDTVDKNIVDLCHANSIEVAVWNANTQESFEKMRKMGCDFIMTDKPSIICPLA